MLIETVSKGGNLLLNVGPTARGEFDERANQRLEGIGAWMKQHSRSIYGCTQAPDTFKVPQNCFLTYDPKNEFCTPTCSAVVPLQDLYTSDKHRCKVF
jgi:alpha-L-fucosidase